MMRTWLERGGMAIGCGARSWSPGCEDVLLSCLVAGYVGFGIRLLSS